MDILNSLVEIHRNRSNFKKWEHEQNILDAKREELYKQKHPSEKELADAKNLGNTIMDVVDIMDQHSEDVAENVETATLPIPMLLPVATMLVGLFATYKAYLGPKLKKVTALNKEFENKNKEKIETILAKVKAELKPELKPKTKLNEDSWLKVDFLNTKSLKRMKISSTLKKEIEPLAKEFTRINGGTIKKLGLTMFAGFGAWVVGWVAANLYTTKWQVDGSKIARYQARKVLQDPKYFVQYTPEQIEKAKANVDKQDNNKNKKVKTDKLKKGFFKSLTSILKDKRAYQKWKSNDKDESMKVDRDLTPEELIEAQKDQEVIQRTVKKINNNAEIYSQNMEVAAGVLIGGTPFLGYLVGEVISRVTDATKIVPNYVKRSIEKYGDENAKTAYQTFLKATEEAKSMSYMGGLFRKWSSFSAFYDAMVKSGTEKNGKGSKDIFKWFKKATPTVLATKLGKNKVFGVAGGLLTGFFGAFIGLKLQKASARAGRYEAKRELEANPQNFIGYTNKDLDNIPDVKPKAESSKIKENIMFVPNAIKQYFRYQKYKDTELKQSKLLKEELVKLDVSTQQMQDAKNLQRKIFNTFEKVDDKSQTYSESLEAAIQTVQPFIFDGFYLLLLSPLIFAGIQASRGKLNYKTVASTVLAGLSKASSIMKTKFFKKYLNNVTDQMTKYVKETKVDTASTKKAFDELGIQEGYQKVKEMAQKAKNTTYNDVINNLSQTIDTATDGLDANLQKELQPIKESLSEFIKTVQASHGEKRLLSGSLAEIILPKINEIFEHTNIFIKHMDEATFKQHKEKLAKMFENNEFIDRLELDKITQKGLTKNLSRIQKIIENMPKAEINNIFTKMFDAFVENPDKFVEFVKTGQFTKSFMTKGLVKALAAAGITWTAFSIAALYILQSWFGDMQLKAGRLGVMKALDELKNPAYYANIQTEDKVKEKVA